MISDILFFKETKGSRNSYRWVNMVKFNKYHVSEGDEDKFITWADKAIESKVFRISIKSAFLISIGIIVLVLFMITNFLLKFTSWIIDLMI
jgi:hypothetical protein